MTSTSVRGWAMVVAATALLAPTAVWVTSQQEAQAAPAIRLATIQLDHGRVQVRNPGAQAKDIGGWTIRDREGIAYTFPADFTISPGATVTVHTGWTDETRIRATLTNADGTVIDTCAVDGSGSSVTC